MSNREKCNRLLDTFTDSQLFGVVTVLESFRAVIDEAMDDAYCDQLLDQYESDTEKDVFISEEDLCKELGITI